MCESFITGGWEKLLIIKDLPHHLIVFSKNNITFNLYQSLYFLKT